MKPTLNLFLKFQFTSLSPDAQPISLGIVSDEIHSKTDDQSFIEFATFGETVSRIGCKSFYSEFSDFEINRCSDWVKENVVSKLKYFPNKIAADTTEALKGNVDICGSTDFIKDMLKHWLSQFSDYDLQFIVDCGSKDWEWIVQLIGEWSVRKIQKERLGARDPDIKYFKTGLPKLPSNISPVPFDLNDLIAIKKGISVREAFDLDREELAFGGSVLMVREQDLKNIGMTPEEFAEEWKKGNALSVDAQEIHTDLSKYKEAKYHALWDANVIKTIYNKLI